MNGLFVHFCFPSEFLQLDNIMFTRSIIGVYNESKPRLVKLIFFLLLLLFLFFVSVFIVFLIIFMLVFNVLFCCLFVFLVLLFCFVLW